MLLTFAEIFRMILAVRFSLTKTKIVKNEKITYSLTKTESSNCVLFFSEGKLIDSETSRDHLLPVGSKRFSFHIVDSFRYTTSHNVFVIKIQPINIIQQNFYGPETLTA